MKRFHKLPLAIITLSLITFLIGFSMPIIETNYATQPNITTLENGLWWAVTTTTGVGYGDFYPTSTIGKVFASALEIIGLTLFGTIIALITINLFKREQQYYWSRTTERFDRLEEKLDKIQSAQHFEIKK